MKVVFFREHKFIVFEKVYEPAEDSFLIADRIDELVEEGDSVLDMGAGCGLLAILSASKAEEVVAVDINPHAVRCVKLNGRINGFSEKIAVVGGSLFEPLRMGELFDIILFNAPYLPVEEGEKRDWLDYAWVGGSGGRQVIDLFVSSAPEYLKTGGCIILVQSTLSGLDRTLKRLRARSLSVDVLDDRKAAFETITMIRAEKRKRRC